VDAIAGWTSVMVSADKVDALLQKNTAVLERIRRIIERGRVIEMRHGLSRSSCFLLWARTPTASAWTIDAGEVGRRMAAAEGVVEVHDLHIWTITSGLPALSAHVLVRSGDDCHARRRELEELLEREFGLRHTTLQVDHVGEREGLQITPLRRQKS
jgi:Co/Zn/Cd efflux system component